MADTKITDMAAASEVDNTDLVPIVQGGVNKKALRSQLLTAGTTEDIEVKAAAGQAVKIVSNDGVSIVKIDSAGDIHVLAPGHNVTLQYDPTAPGDWSGSAPTQVGKALDRCATLLKALNGGTGP